MRWRKRDEEVERRKEVVICLFVFIFGLPLVQAWSRIVSGVMSEGKQI